VDKKEKPTSSALFKLFKVWENRGKLWVEKNATPSLLIKISLPPSFWKDTHRNTGDTHTYPHLFPNWG